MLAWQDSRKRAVAKQQEKVRGEELDQAGGSEEEEEEEGDGEEEAGTPSQFMNDARELLPSASRRDILAAWDRAKSFATKSDVAYDAGSPRVLGKC
jgi:hypothetical protein